MSESEMNSYRLTSMEEPGGERLAQIMREVAEEARVVAGIEAATAEAQKRWADAINRIKNDSH